jgi:hypothetical protein
MTRGCVSHLPLLSCIYSGSYGEGTWNPLSAFHLVDPTCRIPQCLMKLSGGRKLALYVRTWNVTNSNCCQFSLLYADKRNLPRGSSCEASARRWVACTLWGWGRKVACTNYMLRICFFSWYDFCSSSLHLTKSIASCHRRYNKRRIRRCTQFDAIKKDRGLRQWPKPCDKWVAFGSKRWWHHLGYSNSYKPRILCYYWC